MKSSASWGEVPALTNTLKRYAANDKDYSLTEVTDDTEFHPKVLEGGSR
jgi:hypothetical protein